MMSFPQTEITYSVEEYLALERASEERHEFLDGVIYEVGSESLAHRSSRVNGLAHGIISVNIVGQLYNQLRGGPCQVFTKDTKVPSGPSRLRGQSRKGLFSYPDIVVVCGEMRFLDEHQDVLLNPSVIVEVLSPATEAYDRGDKWLRYQTFLPSLTDHILVAQSQP